MTRKKNQHKHSDMTKSRRRYFQFDSWGLFCRIKHSNKLIKEKTFFFLNLSRQKQLNNMERSLTEEPWTANKHIKVIKFINKRMQRKWKMIKHFIDIRSTKIESLTRPSISTGLGEQCLWELKFVWGLWKAIWQGMAKFETCLL